jgi:hypothetical protein
VGGDKLDRGQDRLRVGDFAMGTKQVLQDTNTNRPFGLVKV